MYGRGGKHLRMDESVLPDYEALATSTNESSSLASGEPSTADTFIDEILQPLFPKTVLEQFSSKSPNGFPVTTQQPSEDTAGNNASGMLCNEAMTPETPKTRRNRILCTKLLGGSMQDIDGREANSLPITPSRGRGGRGRGCKGRVLRRQTLTYTSQEDETSLYNALTDNSASLTEVVDRWIEQYKINRENAVLTLMQFFISSSGCKGRITSEMQSTMEFDAIIRRMTEEYEEESAVYPLIATGQQWRKFRENYSKFLHIFVRQCQNSIIYDRFLMDKVISLLTGLSDSQVRAFRHTATFASMKLMTALVNVTVTVATNLRNARRQYEAERQKSRENRAMDRIETLVTLCGELEENMEEVKDMLEYMFKAVFVHRYTDVVPDIRACCIAEIGLWMWKFNEYFLDDSYLKYIGWHLHDKVGEVRVKALEVLQPLYASKDFIAKLDLFTRKFKDRIVDMTLDKEHDVAVQAVKLVTSILKHHRGIVTDKNCEDIYELVYSSHRDVAHAAGEFLNERLFRVNTEAVVDAKTERGKRRVPNTPNIRDLVLFFIEAEVHEHAAYLVDSLIESNRMMKDWECMTGLLLEEPGIDEETLNNQQETCLIEIMVCCVKQAATGEAPIGRGPARKIVSAKKQMQVQDDKQKLTEHFVQTLPLLLDKYQADPEKIGSLLAVPQYFELDIYTIMRQEQNLDALLKSMYGIVEKMHDANVLETAAKTLECLCAEDLGIFQQCDVARCIILDHIVDKYKEANEKYTTLIDNCETPDKDEIFNLVHSLKKVSVYYSLHDMNSYEIWDSLYKSLEEVRFFSRKLPDEALTYCIRSCHFSILWSQNSLLNAEPSDVRVANEIRRLTERLNSFMDLMMFFVDGEGNGSVVSPPAIIREEAYVSICDCLIFFNNRTTKDPNPVLLQLAYQPDDRMQTMLNRFIQENVLSEGRDDGHDVEGKIERLHKLRNFLAGYCKVVIHTTIAMSVAADVFKHYVKYYNDYGDIIKSTLGKARDNDRTQCARTMLFSLRILYNEMIAARGEENRSSEEFTAIKELAKRFALLFGFDVVKNCEAVLTLHEDGVLFAITPPDGVERDPWSPPENLSFLEILGEFSYKLVEKDKRIVLNFIDTELQAGLPTSRSDEWKPLLLYRNSLMHGFADQALVTSKRIYARRKKDHVAVEETIDEADDESTYDSAGKPTKTAAMKTPLLITKVTSPGGPRTNGFDESSDATSISISPMPAIEDSSPDPYDGSEDGMKSLQIHSPTNLSTEEYGRQAKSGYNQRIIRLRLSSTRISSGISKRLPKVFISLTSSILKATIIVILCLVYSFMYGKEQLEQP